jgi:hypothetical protein
MSFLAREKGMVFVPLSQINESDEEPELFHANDNDFLANERERADNFRQYGSIHGPAEGVEYPRPSEKVKTAKTSAKD